MMNDRIHELVKNQRIFFDRGETRTILFRLRQLRMLKKMVKDNERELLNALKMDLKKPMFEAYTAELMLFYEEVNLAIGKLRGWSRPVKTKTPLALEPSSSKITHEPKGLVLIISPWNYPFSLLMLPLVGALAAGNCVIVKPSNKSAHTSAVISKMIRETFSPEYLAVVEGTGSETGPALIEPHRFDHIFFTGSASAGREIMALAAPHLTPVTLELGGKSPAVVMADANLAVSAKRIMWGKCYNAGQTCLSPDYLLVHQSVKDEMVNLMTESIKEFFGDNPASSDSYARIIDKNHFSKLKEHLKQGRILTGGQIDQDDLYIAPTLMDGITLDDSIMKNEVFGPILPIITFKEPGEAVSIIRKNRYPLALYLFTENRRNERKILEQIEFGGGCINNCLIHASNPNLPFGGIGTSGMGRYHGKASFELFSNCKILMKSSTLVDPSIKYAPYDDRKLKLAKTLMKL